MRARPPCLNSGDCLSRADYMHALAGSFIDDDAKSCMAYVTASYDALARLKLSLERDVELMALSLERIDRSQHALIENWRWAERPCSLREALARS